MKGSPPKRRSVLTVWEWVAEVTGEWISEIRPLVVRVGGSPALWPTERADRISLVSIDHRFAAAREALGLPDGLDFHSLRRSYVTHLIEDGWDPFFVQLLGHEHSSTTSIYTNSQVLHQAGEKSQVSRSQRCRNSVSRAWAAVV